MDSTSGLAMHERSRTDVLGACIKMTLQRGGLFRETEPFEHIVALIRLFHHLRLFFRTKGPLDNQWSLPADSLWLISQLPHNADAGWKQTDKAKMNTAARFFQSWTPKQASKTTKRETVTVD
jgi:hypothetical protein